jgi:hypothetical protein
MEFSKKNEVSLVVMGKPPLGFFYNLNPRNIFRQLTSLASNEEIDILMVS